MEAEAVTRQLRQFVLAALRVPDLADEDDIFDVGGASSLFAMELVLFVEGTFDIALEDGDLERDNFRSVAALAALVARKRGESA